MFLLLVAPAKSKVNSAAIPTLAQVTAVASPVRHQQTFLDEHHFHYGGNSIGVKTTVKDLPNSSAVGIPKTENAPANGVELVEMVEDPATTARTGPPTADDLLTAVDLLRDDSDYGDTDSFSDTYGEEPEHLNAATSPGLSQGANVSSSTTRTLPSPSQASNTTATADDAVAKPLALTPTSAEGTSDAADNDFYVGDVADYANDISEADDDAEDSLEVDVSDTATAEDLVDVVVVAEPAKPVFDTVVPPADSAHAGSAVSPLAPATASLSRLAINGEGGEDVETVSGDFFNQALICMPALIADNQ
jgi:hypothetical protein